MIVVLLAMVYLINLVIFTLAGKAQLAAGGLLMMALGGLWIYLLGAPETLTCNPEMCLIVRPRFLWTAKRVDVVPRASIEEVRVEEVHIMSHDGPGRTAYQLVLHGRDKVAHFFSVEDSQQRAQGIANRVNTYLKTPSHESVVVRRVPWVMVMVGIVGIVIGVLLILSALQGWSFTT